MTPPMETELPRLPQRAADSHKGTYGRILLIGGSRGMSGSISLAGMAALRSGAGLVYLAVPEPILETVAGFEPSYITVPLPADDEGRIAESALATIREHAERADAVAIGPGLGRSDGLTRLVDDLYSTLAKPMVVDADALNALAALGNASCPLPTPAGARVLTPHPGEFARLVHASGPVERQHACQQADALASNFSSTIILKGHGTYITDGKVCAINTTGNPGMATGGTGDVLTGMVAALLAAPIEPPRSSLASVEFAQPNLPSFAQPWLAARLAVHLHGLAGDVATHELGEVSLIASDLIRFLPRAFQEFAAPS